MPPEMLARIMEEDQKYASGFLDIPANELEKMAFFGQGDNLWDGWAKVDIWGMGTVLFAVLFGYDPFYPMAASCCPQFELLRQGNTEGFFESAATLLADPSQVLRVGGSRLVPERQSLHAISGAPVSKDAQAILLRLLDPDCRSRATLQEVADHPWLQGPVLDEVGVGLYDLLVFSLFFVYVLFCSKS